MVLGLVKGRFRFSFRFFEARRGVSRDRRAGSREGTFLVVHVRLRVGDVGLADLRGSFEGSHGVLHNLIALINRDLRRAKSLSEAKIKEVGENIRLFSDLYRATFQSKQGSDQATPKAHCLEAHFVSDDPNFPEFVQRWRNSGIFGEDAIESTHAKINRLKRRAFGIRNRLDRKKFLVRAHDDSQHPEALEAIDKSRERSKRKKGDGSKGRKKKRRKKE